MRGWFDGSRANNGVLVRFYDEYFNGSNRGKRGDTITSREGNPDFTPTLVVEVVCRVDTTEDGVVDTRDMLLYLGAWVQRDAIADWNRAGVIDTRDSTDFLADWAHAC